MTNLTSQDLRARDVSKLASYKSSNLVWDKDPHTDNDWVLASLSSSDHLERLKRWLNSKKIHPENQAVLVTSIEAPVSRLCWQELLSNPERFFGNNSFKLYEVNFKWHLEYAEQEIARFGRYNNA